MRTATTLNDPIAEVESRIEALTLQGLSQGAAHKRVMKDVALRNRFVIATCAKQGRFKAGLLYARRMG